MTAKLQVTAGHSKFVSASAYLSVAAAKRLRDGSPRLLTPPPRPHRRGRGVMRLSQMQLVADIGKGTFR